MDMSTMLGTCYPLGRVKKMYPDIELSPIGAPSRKMSEQTTYFYTKRPWGRLSFCFKKEKSDCLRDIVLAPDK
jgi:hypothetical protein